MALSPLPSRPALEGQPAQLTLRIYREWTPTFADTPEDKQARLTSHKERAKLIHGLVNTLGLDVQSWGETDNDYPREHVDVSVVIDAAAVLMAMVQVFKIWVKARDPYIKYVEITTPDGQVLRLSHITPRELKGLINSLKLSNNAKSK
jgi:hypothetical protein